MNHLHSRSDSVIRSKRRKIICSICYVIDDHLAKECPKNSKFIPTPDDILVKSFFKY